ncbi:hypothetical protein NQZ68_013390 [Dissostichus eleginoides]|nr:hypothetical protein NQZ68_013390 [Dissostichus eleginoides]
MASLYSEDTDERYIGGCLQRSQSNLMKPQPHSPDEADQKLLSVKGKINRGEPQRWRGARAVKAFKPIDKQPLFKQNNRWGGPNSCCLLGNLLSKNELPSTGDSVETKRYADMLTLALLYLLVSDTVGKRRERASFSFPFIAAHYLLSRLLFPHLAASPSPPLIHRRYTTHGFSSGV